MNKSVCLFAYVHTNTYICHVLINKSIIMSITAINPKHQGKVNRAINWLVKHNEANELRDQAENNGNAGEFCKFQKKCSDSFDKFLIYMDELPQNQQQIIYASDLY